MQRADDRHLSEGDGQEDLAPERQHPRRPAW
jgi:hypothetical protein